MELPVVNHEDYFAKIGDDHKFPINKFGELANYLTQNKIVKKFHKPSACSFETLSYAHSKNYILSEKLEKKLYELDLVSNYYIDSFTNEKIIYKIIYNSTPDKFISEFTSNNFKLNTSNSIWSVE